MLRIFLVLLFAGSFTGSFAGTVAAFPHSSGSTSTSPATETLSFSVLSTWQLSDTFADSPHSQLLFFADIWSQEFSAEIDADDEYQAVQRVSVNTVLPVAARTRAAPENPLFAQISGADIRAPPTA